jgi:hypothetical protein
MRLHGKLWIALGAAAVLAGPAVADVNSKPSSGGTPKIVLPNDGDEYSKLVARAASGDKTLDFHALRLAYLHSAARRRENFDQAIKRRDALMAALEADDIARARDVATEMISSNYIDMWGHKFRRQACAALHDDACAAQGHFVEFGLLESIVKTGDGKTCPTGWDVVTVTEEYFMVDMTESQPLRQYIVGGKPPCDAIIAVDKDGKQTTYFFKIDTVLKDEGGSLYKP